MDLSENVDRWFLIYLMELLVTVLIQVYWLIIKFSNLYILFKTLPRLRPIVFGYLEKIFLVLIKVVSMNKTSIFWKFWYALSLFWPIYSHICVNHCVKKVLAVIHICKGKYAYTMKTQSRNILKNTNKILFLYCYNKSVP